MVDFGLSRKFDPSEWMTSKVGTCYFMAPELLRGKYNAKADCWSLGCILFLILLGDVPYNGSTDANIMQRILSEPYNKKRKVRF